MTENQFRFIIGRSSIEVIHLLKQLIENSWKRKQNLHIVSIDIGKSYDNDPTEIMWRILEKKRC